MAGRIELRPNEGIVFIGDSITDADHQISAHKPFGFGYVHFVANHLLARYPTLGLRILNSGVNGDTIRDLADRWQQDCIAHKPDIVSILIGANDVWRHFQGDEYLDDAVYADEFESTYRQLLKQVKEECNSRLVIIEPFMFCADDEYPPFRELRRFNEIVQAIAGDFDAVLVPLQRLIDGRISDVPPENWSADMVHPHIWAHCWIAHRWLEATGLW